MSKKKKIRICYPFVGDSIGGSHLSTIELIKKLDKSKLLLTPLGVNNKIFSPRNISKNKFIVLCITNDFIRRGTHYLIKAYISYHVVSDYILCLVILIMSISNALWLLSGISFNVLIALSKCSFATFNDSSIAPELRISSWNFSIACLDISC